MRFIDTIPVWGEHDEATLAQIRRCASDQQVAAAALMADGHKGYSMPIGGVIGYRETVSPSGVGYDISCLVAGTPVTTRDGYWLPIEEVRPVHTVTCWDGEQVRPIEAQQGVIARPTRAVITIRLANGRSITATPDHLIRTREGWKPASELYSADLIACAVFVGIPYVRPVEMPQAIKDHSMSIDDARFPALIRLLGVVSGDGHLSQDGKRISVYTTNEIDAIAIAEDFARLGYKAHITRRERHENRKAEIHIYVNSVALHALFTALGSPMGKKSWPEAPMPWLFAMPAWVRAHFLSAFCSAEMMTPRLLNGRLPNLQLKQVGEHDHAIQFLGRLFESLGFAVSVATSGEPRGERQDYVLQLLGGGAAQVRFMEEVGFCYASEKRMRGAEAASVYWQWSVAVLERAMAQAEARQLKASGMYWKDVVATVASRYAVSTGFVYHAVYDNRGTPRLPANTFAPATNGEVVWVPVVAIDPGGESEVYDIVTGDPAHAFFASGIVVHNCGNKAVRTTIRADELRPSIRRVMDQIASTVVFGVGQTSDKARDHPLFDDPTWRDIPQIGALKELARAQLGTVGSGNHYVDLFADEGGWVWVGCHFGSRGFGHKTASGFLNLAAGRAFDAKAPGESMDQPATLISLRTELGQAYWQAMELAGRYAYAGRDFVVAQVLEILGTQAVDEVHNHHNYAWKEIHNGEELIVVRKGATPAQPGQRGFIGGSMGDISVIIEGVESDEARASLYSTVHGAGRVMSRTAAAGKVKWRKDPTTGRKAPERVGTGAVSREMMLEWLRRVGVELRGAGVDESPHVYRRLPEVLAAHAGSIRILHTLTPLGVAMAGEEIVDPYKD